MTVSNINWQGLPIVAYLPYLWHNIIKALTITVSRMCKTTGRNVSCMFAYYKYKLLC